MDGFSVNVTSAQVDLQRGVPPKAKFTAVIIESRAAECFTANQPSGEVGSYYFYGE